jgi:hypothetical protein
MSLAIVLLYGLAFYAIVGLCIAAAFASFGVTRIFGTPTSMTAGARILIFPGAAALWPYVLLRWLKSGRQP